MHHLCAHSSPAAGTLVAARAGTAVLHENPQAETVAWWVAALALSWRMGWNPAVPLLATQIYAPLLRTGPDRRRARPGRSGLRAGCVPCRRSRRTIGQLRRQDLIASGPRVPQPSAPYTYVTTRKFLEQFGLDMLRDLPDLEALEDAGLLSRGAVGDEMPPAPPEEEGSDILE